MTTYLWVDCDPGHDDAFALILACHSANPAVIVAGVSTVCGNQTVDKTTDNALRVLHLLGRDDVQVHRGADKPLIREKRTCPEIHGDSGLDGPDIPDAPRACNPLPPVVAMANAFERVSQIPSARMVLVATGALTNVALFCAVYPELATRVELTFMGGALGKGNTGPTAEFNIQCDPEAASVALNHAFKTITMVPLETTHRALATSAVRRRIRIGPNAAGGTEEADDGGCIGEENGGGATTRFRALADELLMFFAETYERVFGFPHPPCTTRARCFSPSRPTNSGPKRCGSTWSARGRSPRGPPWWTGGVKARKSRATWTWWWTWTCRRSGRRCASPWITPRRRAR